MVADLLDPPAEWAGAFDLVVESITVQSMPPSVRAEAIANVAGMVARSGELLVITGIREQSDHTDGPPWLLTRVELDSFATRGLRTTQVEQISCPGWPTRWRAVFSRA